MNIHILSNSPTRVNSGFGIVCRNLALGLSKLGHTVSVSDMQNIYNKEYWNGICIYPMNSVIDAATENTYYINELLQLSKNLKESKADVMIIIYPAYDNVISSNHLHEVCSNTIWYYPVEGENLPDTYINELKKVKKIVPITKQGKKELEKKIDSRKIEKEIYHGFDEKTFYRLDRLDKSDKSDLKFGENLHYCIWSLDRYWLVGDRKELCERGCYKCNGLDSNCKYYKEEEIVLNIHGDEYKGNISNLDNLKDQFGAETIFGFVGENNGKRKKIERLLNSFSMLCKSNDIVSSETLLLMHTMPVSNNGLDLWEYIKKYELDGIGRKIGEKIGEKNKVKVLFTYGGDGLGNSWSDKALNIMYNIYDVNVSCSSGEGFGIPTLESMACGKPQIAPDFSSFSELVGKSNGSGSNFEKERGLLADVQGYEILNNGMRRALVSSKSFAECMRIMCDDKNLRNKLGDNAYNFSQQYTWNNISKDFDVIVKSLDYNGD